MSARNHGGEPANYEHTKQRPLSVAIARSATFEPFQLSRTTVARILKDHGIDASRRMSESEKSKAAELYERGQSSSAIGKQLGYDNHTILRALRRRGVSIRLAANRR